MQARHVVRQGVFAHGIGLAVLLLMLGLIHVAPLGATPAGVFVQGRAPGRGWVKVHAFPWAKVSIDGKDIGTTPLGTPVELSEGPHVVRFEHAYFAPVEKKLDVAAGANDAAQVLGVDFCQDKATLLPGKTVPAGACEGALQ